MTTAMEQASALLKKAATMTRDAISEACQELSEEAREIYYKLRKDSMFSASNAKTECRQEHLSPSGAYKLVVTPFATGKGSWNYSQGLVFKVGSDEPIAEIRRNYGSFPFLFVEDHPNGHSYLIGGEDYQGQTVVELDTGKRRDHLDSGAKKGVGFCWAEYTFDRDSQILVVDGCFWACPYEYQFFDFSDPMSGWPQLEPKVDGKVFWVDSDGKAPKIEKDQITTYECSSNYDEEDEDEEKEREVVAYQIFKRDGLSLVQVESWVSDEEQARRKARDEARAAYEAKLAKWKAEDPLYLAHRELQKASELSPSGYASRGITYPNWCPDFEGEEGRWCQRIVEKHDTYKVDLEWAMETGPIKLVIFKDGKTHDTVWFEHSVEGMEKAYAHARSLVS